MPGNGDTPDNYKEAGERLKRTAGERDFFPAGYIKTGSSVFKTGRNRYESDGWQPDRGTDSDAGDLLCRFEVSVNGTNSFEQARICCGGVDVRGG